MLKKPWRLCLRRRSHAQADQFVQSITITRAQEFRLIIKLYRIV